MGNEYDVVVAGGGSNSLAAAAYLAKAGMSVCVLEKNPVIGGGLVCRELTEPGFKHDPARHRPDPRHGQSDAPGR